MKLIIAETKPSQAGRLWSLRPGFTLAQNGQNGHRRKSDDHKTELGHSDHLTENSGRAKLARRGTS